VLEQLLEGSRAEKAVLPEGQVDADDEIRPAQEIVAVGQTASQQADRL